jgi:hypothetical protein
MKKAETISGNTSEPTNGAKPTQHMEQQGHNQSKKNEPMNGSTTVTRIGQKPKQ